MNVAVDNQEPKPLFQHQSFVLLGFEADEESLKFLSDLVTENGGIAVDCCCCCCCCCCCWLKRRKHFNLLNCSSAISSTINFALKLFLLLQDICSSVLVRLFIALWLTRWPRQRLFILMSNLFYEHGYTTAKLKCEYWKLWILLVCCM